MNTLGYRDSYPELQRAIERQRERHEYLAALARERRARRRAARRDRIRGRITRATRALGSGRVVT